MASPEGTDYFALFHAGRHGGIGRPRDVVANVSFALEVKASAEDLRNLTESKGEGGNVADFEVENVVLGRAINGHFAGEDRLHLSLRGVCVEHVESVCSITLTSQYVILYSTPHYETRLPNLH